MLSVQTKGKLLVLKVTGELRAEHFDDVAELVGEKIEAQEEALVLLDLRRYEGARDFQTAWKEFKLVTHYANQVAKIAVVGSLDWQKLVTALASPFTRAEDRFFESDDVGEASKWLRA